MFASLGEDLAVHGVSKVRARIINEMSCANADGASYDFHDVPSREVMHRVKYVTTKREPVIEKVALIHYVLCMYLLGRTRKLLNRKVLKSKTPKSKTPKIT